MYLGIILLIVGVLLVLPKIPIFKTILGTGLILMGLSLYLNKDVKDIVNLNNIAIFFMPNYTFKMGRLFIDVHYDAALLWIERCNDSRVFLYKNTSGRNVVCVG